MFVKNFYRIMARNYFAYNNQNAINIQVADGGSMSPMNIVCDTFSYNSAKYPYLGTVVKSYSGGGGILFGNGNTPVTVDDYKLSGDVISTITATVAVTWDYTDDGCSGTAVCTLTNTGSSAITIAEVGLFAGFTSNNNMNVLIERTLLDEPITIPAGGIGKVTYTITFAYPTE